MAESNDNVNETPEPEEISSEDVVGGQETPSADALDREQAIVDETPGESESHRRRGDLDHQRRRVRRPTRTSSTSRKTRRRA